MRKNVGWCIALSLLSLVNLSYANSNLTDDKAHIALENQYHLHCLLPSDINEHLPALRNIARECSSVVEIGVRSVVSSWGLLQGLRESPYHPHTYLGIDIGYPPQDRFELLKDLTEANGISFDFWEANDMDVDFEPVDLVFIDTLHIYAQLFYELEKFAPKALKYIAMHDTTSYEFIDCGSYKGDFTEYPSHISRTKRGLWTAVEDFLKVHPEWRIYQRHKNNNGLTILKRVGS